ncbi:DUF397 domain-containing protein [Saccharopolyspora flava]|uniref:DUF397 domain-containing protein n=1 Tax=Saccharopolyspora flava TaxID=95161 RepID=A0A1I6RMV4_9PSEU|nr:DUF397 domain-containing protein [Saccharopolyspora flava]SFS65788.1 protein of unknown function [Saccharopolyspora flava]
MPGTYSTWRKSSRSGTNGGECVEIGFADTGRAIRDTKQAGDTHQPTLEFSNDAFATFLSRVKSGDF